MLFQVPAAARAHAGAGARQVGAAAVPVERLRETVVGQANNCQAQNKYRIFFMRAKVRVDWMLPNNKAIDVSLARLAAPFQCMFVR